MQYFASFKDKQTGRTKEIYNNTLRKLQHYTSEKLFLKISIRHGFKTLKDTFSTVGNFLKKLNGQTIVNKKGEKTIIKRGLNTIGENLDIRNLTSYVMRHSWATIAAELDIPKETISAALGHGKKSVTDIYIQFDRKKIDEANRRVIDYVLNQKT